MPATSAASHQSQLLASNRWAPQAVPADPGGCQTAVRLQTHPSPPICNSFAPQTSLPDTLAIWTPDFLPPTSTAACCLLTLDPGPCLAGAAAAVHFHALTFKWLHTPPHLRALHPKLLSMHATIVVLGCFGATTLQLASADR